MNAVSIFAGAGGFDLAARSVGIDVARSVERDADCCTTLAAAGFHPMQADVDDIDAWSAGLPPIDLLFGGPPCQPFSIAGKGEGGDDERDGFPAAIEAAQALRPRWLVLENVGGFLSPRFAKYREQLLEDLHELFPSVSCWRLDAADQGVPQHRRRVFIVAGPSKVRPPAQTHCDPRKGSLFGLAPWNGWGPALGISAGLLDSGQTSERSGGRVPCRVGPDEPAPTVRAQQGTGHTLYGAGVTGMGRPHDEDEPAPSVTTKGTAYIAGPGWGDPSPTITTTDGVGLGSSAARDRAEADLGRRRLTVEECAILQDFPTGYPFAGSKESQYRQVGNAVPMRLGAAVLRAVALTQP